MLMTVHRARLGSAVLVLGLLTAGLFVVAPAGAGSEWTEIGSGPDFTYDSPNPFSGAAAATVLAREFADGNLQVRLEMTGVDAAGRRFGAHVHTNPCGSSPGSSGGHFVNPDASGSLRHREIWLDLTVDTSGTGQATATRDWTVVGDRSVVIHADTTDHEGVAGARLACMDVDFDELS